MEGDETVKDLEKEVMKSIHKRVMKKKKKKKSRARMRNPWRNRMWDRGMHNGPHPGFPTLQKWREFRRENIKIDDTPYGKNSEYDRYKRFRDIALHQADEIYDRFHNGPNGDIGGHTPAELKQRYHIKKEMKGPRYKPKHQPYGLPPDEPRLVPYHHGKYIGVPRRKSWFMAQQFCREQYGTNLASVMNMGELNEMRHVCDEVAGYGHCWIGLRRPFGTWQDGKPVILSNWGEKGVNNLHEEPLNCVEILYEEKVWHAQLCTVMRSFICEIPRKRTRGKFIGIGKTLSWESAENYCQQTYNTDLASISNKVENRLAMNLCRDISSDMHHCWIGLIKPYKLWTDGEPAKKFLNFNKNGFSPDHKGVDIHEGHDEKPEPYDEDHQKSSFYPAAHAFSYPADVGDSEMRDTPNKPPPVDKKAEEEKKKKDELEKKFIDEKKPGAKQMVPETDDNRKLDKQEAALENKNEKIKEEEEELEKQLKGGAKGKGKGEKNIQKGKDKRDQCVQINTSYGGTWDKTRCSFRHFFLCINPAWSESSESSESEESEEEEDPFGGAKGKKGKHGKKHKKGKPHPKPHAKPHPKAKAKVKPKENKLEQKVENAVEAFNGKEGYKKLKKQEMKKDMEREDMMREGERMGGHQERRRLVNGYDNDNDFLGGIMKKAGGFLKQHGGKIMQGAMGMMGGGGGGGGGDQYTPGDINRNNNRDRFRREGEGSAKWKRREVRRRRRKRRRHRFKRWLKKHYGRGYRKKCKHCPVHHIRIRSLPRHMHWAPLAGLIPMFGVQGLHRQKKSPKIHIVAKVHLPKHRTLDTGYLDYGLLTKLLFNDHAKKRGGPLLEQLAAKYRKIEHMVKPKPGADLANGYNAQGNFDRSEEEKKLYKKWDRTNDRRAEKANVARRRLIMDDDESVNVVCRCRMVEEDGSGNSYEICMNYYVDSMEMSVDVKSLEYKVLREEKRRVFRDVMRLDQQHYSDHRVVDDGEGDDGEGEYVLFEPIDGNLGWAIYKYELMDWHWVKQYEDRIDDGILDKYGYGEFDNFNNYIRFGQRFELVYNGGQGYECSVTLVGLPFRMCMGNGEDDGMKVYFEKDEKYDVLDASFSFRFKEFIDNEFENGMFVFDDNKNWDEINVINMNEYIEKCSYLHIAKICMKLKNNDNSMTASISFQLMNKQMILDEN